MKKQTSGTLLSVLTAISLLLTSLPVYALAATDSDAVESTSAQAAKVLNQEDVPAVLSYDQMVAAGHIDRIRADEEELNTVVFENADATRTAYIFTENVKYVADNGTVYDKSNELTAMPDGTYRNLKNDIQISYPAKLADGITVQYKSLSFSMVPAVENEITPPLQEEEITFPDSAPVTSVVYDSVFGANTSVEYIQTYSGFKENIYLNTNPGTNQFSFLVQTNGATVELQEGLAVILMDDVPVGNFGEVYIYDSNGATCYGETSVTEVKPGYAYILTLTVPTVFLESSATVYPVVVDPSFAIRDNSTAKVIEDATVFTEYHTNVGSATTLFVGNLSLAIPALDYGIAYGLVKFPLLNSTSASFLQHYNAGRVTSVRYNFADISCKRTNTIQANRLAVSWNESSVTYSTVVGRYSSVPTTSVSITAQTATKPYPRYTLELLPFIESYGTADLANQGILLQAADTTTAAMSLGASESYDDEDGITLASSKPYVSYTYYAMPTDETEGIVSGGVYQIKNNATGKALSYGSSLIQASPAATNTSQQFIITYVEYGRYRISPISNTGISLARSNTTLTTAANTSSETQLWFIVPIEGGYRLHAANSADNVITTVANPYTLAVANNQTGSVWDIRPPSLDVPLFAQSTSSNCSGASGSMLLHYHGCNISESEFMDTAKRFHATETTHVHNVTRVVNHYLNEAGKGTTYQYIPHYNYDEQSMAALIERNIANGNPMIVLLADISVSDAPFNYNSTRHYVVIKGLYYTLDGTAMVVVNDPFDDNYNPDLGANNEANEYNIPFSTLYQFFDRWDYSICVNL